MSNLAGLGFCSVAIVIIIFLRCVGQSVRARWPYLSRLELPAVSRKNAVFFMPSNKTFVDRRWLNVGFVPFFACFQWNPTTSRSKKKTLKITRPLYPAILTWWLVIEPKIIATSDPFPFARGWNPGNSPFETWNLNLNKRLYRLIRKKCEYINENQ